MEEQYSLANRLKTIFFSEISVCSFPDKVVVLLCESLHKKVVHTNELQYIIIVVIYRILTFRVDSKAQLLTTLFKYLGCIGTERCVHWHVKNSRWVSFLTIIKGCRAFSGP